MNNIKADLKERESEMRHSSSKVREVIEMNQQGRDGQAPH